MQKMKKGVALALATTMVLGSSMTAFASETAPTTGGNGSATGAGATEGHVEKEVLNVVLPTDSDTTTFKYTMDPERLIQETDGGKYAEGTHFPDKATDTGVYFLTAANTYENTSNTLQAINKSSCDITLTVDVQATQNTAKDITLVTAPSTSTDAAELYLGLKVGDTSQAVSTTKATVTKTISGSSGNFETAVKEGAYVYQEKADATTWKAMNIAMTGAVNNKAIASDTTAPTVGVTWKWEKAAQNASAADDQVDYSTAPDDVAPSIAEANKTKTLAADTEVTIPVDLGSGDLAAEGVASVVPKHVAGYDMLSKSLASYSNGVITIPESTVNTMIATPSAYLPGGKCVLVITFDDTAETPVEVTLNAPAG